MRASAEEIRCNLTVSLLDSVKKRPCELRDSHLREQQQNTSMSEQKCGAGRTGQTTLERLTRLPVCMSKSVYPTERHVEEEGMEEGKKAAKF